MTISQKRKRYFEKKDAILPDFFLSIVQYLHSIFLALHSICVVEGELLYKPSAQTRHQLFPFGILHIWYICKHASCKKAFCLRNSRNCCHAEKGVARIDPGALRDWHNKAIQNLERCRYYRTNPKQAEKSCRTETSCRNKNRAN